MPDLRTVRTSDLYEVHEYFCLRDRVNALLKLVIFINMHIHFIGDSADVC